MHHSANAFCFADVTAPILVIGPQHFRNTLPALRDCILLGSLSVRSVKYLSITADTRESAVLVAPRTTISASLHFAASKSEVPRLSRRVLPVLGSFQTR